MPSCYHSVVEESFVSKLIPYLIGPLIVVLLFIIGRFLDSQLRLREIRRNWYLKVIIEPNIDKLEKFYQEVQEALKKSVEDLVTLQTTLPMTKYLAQKSIEMGKFQVLKRNFEIQFISLVQTNYEEISLELTSLLRKLEDQITSCLDRPDLSVDHLNGMETKIANNYYGLVKILYKPLSLKSRMRNKKSKS